MPGINDEFMTSPQDWMLRNVFIVGCNLLSREIPSRKPLSFVKNLSSNVGNYTVWKLDFAGDSNEASGSPIPAIYIPPMDGTDKKIDGVEIPKNSFIFTESLTGCGFGISADGSKAFHASASQKDHAPFVDNFKMHYRLWCKLDSNAKLLLPGYGIRKKNNEYTTSDQNVKENSKLKNGILMTFAVGWVDNGKPILAYYTAYGKIETEAKVNEIKQKWTFVL